MEMIENNILSGTWKTGELIISTTQISKLYKVNPTTAVKAVSCLSEDGMLYKKPGIGMCVAEGAREKILERRKGEFMGPGLDAFLAEAAALKISNSRLIKLIREKKKHD
jgi:DNA-binding transcriptional regulator YhcF (GntR family)